MTALLEVDNLTLGFGRSDPVVDGVSFSVDRGQTLALVGESGSGKTLTCRSVLRILPGTAQIRSGSVRFTRQGKTQDLLTMPRRRLRDIRGDRISMIFQEPMRALSPLIRIGNQVGEVLRIHRNMSKSEARGIVIDTFAKVGFVDPERAFRAYPFELSGGMRQRAMIAMAMVAQPDILIADEPTTALDVTTQAQVLGLIKDLQAETGMALILVTHDLGVVANMADSVVVMHRGRVMEAGPADPILRAPAHPYTQQLFDAAPSIPAGAMAAPPPPEEDFILRMRNVNKTYTMRADSMGASGPQGIAACRAINFDVKRGKTLAIVGESGSGKTTCARIALGAERPDPGSEVLFNVDPTTPPIEVNKMDAATRMRFQREAQMVFQDPYSSLNPRMRIVDALTEPLEIHGIGTRRERRDMAAERLRQVGLSPDMLTRYPHAFSGGQRQRLSVARALTLDPTFIVCDEPTSALDVSVQDRILRLLEELQDELGLSYLFISHDLAVVARVADEVAVMRQGMIVEQAIPDVLFHEPMHPYTRALIAAQPTPDPDRPIDLNIVANGAGRPDSWPEEFRFLEGTAPDLRQASPGHMVRSHA